MGNTVWTGGSSPLANFRCFLYSCPHFRVFDSRIHGNSEECRFPLPDRVRALYYCALDRKGSADFREIALLASQLGPEGSFEEVMFPRGEVVERVGCPHGFCKPGDSIGG